jgi:3-isopropylmalate/(R)-2-methylmalate dehydratase large subunit
MGMTITEKILSHASNSNKVTPGDIVFANVDKVMIHDVSGPGVMKVFKELEKKGYPVGKIWNPDNVWISEDHFVPASDRVSADNVIQLTKWAQKNGIQKHFKYGFGQYGICHTLSHEEGLV